MSLLIWLAPGLKGVNHILRKISIIFCHNIQTKTLLFLLYQYFHIVVLHFLEKSLIKENSIYISSSFSSINLCVHDCLKWEDSRIPVVFKWHGSDHTILAETGRNWSKLSFHSICEHTSGFFKANIMIFWNVPYKILNSITN